MNTLRAWHNDPALKAEVLSRMLQHRVEDGIIQGAYQRYDPKLASQYKGCLIGCTLPMERLIGHNGHQYITDPESWHDKVEELYGIPAVLNHVFDRLFESLPPNKAAWFAVSTIEAIPVGADLTVAIDLFANQLNTYSNLNMLQENWDEEWLKVALAEHLESFEEDDPQFDMVTVELAERLLGYLAACAPVAAPRIPAPHPETLNFVPTPEEINV